MAEQRIRLDINNVLQAGAEHGLTEDELEAAASQGRQAAQAVQERRQGGDLRWMELPYADISAIEELATEVRTTFDTFVVLGIGGSALGNIALNTALNGPFHNLLPQRAGMRLFVLDNSDPEFNAGLLDAIDLQKTVFNVISKSGSTGETLSAFLFFRGAVANAAGSNQVKDHFILTTDLNSGPLRQLVQSEGFRSLPVPDGVGGRFSVLSPVGLLSAAAAGIDVRQLLAGAAYADELTRRTDPWSNPATMGALVQYLLYRKGVDIVVMMPYAQRLQHISDWFAQLWAESLGKRVNRKNQVVNIGPTPAKALGATDQHSQLQLYTEGPYNKLINFLRVEEFTVEGTLPPAYEDMDAFRYLGGRSFAELINTQQEATAIALTEAGRPNMTHILPTISEFTVGQLLYMLEVQTAIAGELWDINAFDQPGVEASKIATYALLGRVGYEKQRQAIDEARGRRNPRAMI